ncbi:MAG: metal ABC transporter permease [Pseudomonadota bacterium]
MLDDFLTRAALAGTGLALAAGPLGCFIVWRRMAYFGDATAHAAILGVALSLAFSISIYVGVTVTALAMGLAITALSERSLGMDTLLGVAAHSGLAIGLVTMSFFTGRALDVEAYLFGEILAVGRADLVLIWSGAAAVMALLAFRWTGLVTATLSPDLARADGIDPRREQLILTLALALVVAVALKIVGALLITAMLIIPAATARAVARTPEGMAIIASLIGIAAVMAGIGASMRYDTPTGPSIVVAAVLFFALSSLIRKRRAG